MFTEMTMTTPVEETPSYEEMIGYYLRDDVSQVLWEVSNRRPLKYYYHSEHDMRAGSPFCRETPPAISLHCVESTAEFRSRVKEAAGRSKEHAQGFCPFFGMGNTVCEPGKPDHLIGYDFRFEFDLDLQSSFRMLIPVLALLEHYGVPVLAKYSGHRSLHLVVPAEAFPLNMRKNPVHREWMSAFDILGDLFCCFSPQFNRSSARVAKAFVLSAPFSFHRYHGLLSIPVNLDQALVFDPSSAKLANFPGVSWIPEQLDGNGENMQNLLELARKRLEEPESVLAVAESIFVGRKWELFIQSGYSSKETNDPVLASLSSGLPGIKSISEKTIPSKTLRDRLRLASLFMEIPEAKEVKFAALIARWSWGPTPESIAAVRQTVSAAFVAWVRFGLDGAINHLLGVCVNPELEVPTACAVRLFSLLPESAEAKVTALQQRWETHDHAPSPEAAFFILCLAELSPGPASALPVISNGTPLDSPLCRQISSAKWKTEKNPDKAAAALCLGFGVQTVRSWIDNPGTPEATTMVRHVFSNLQRDPKDPKFAYAARKALAFPAKESH